MAQINASEFKKMECFPKNLDQKFDYYLLKLDTCNLGDYLNGEEKLATYHHHHPDLSEKEQTKMAAAVGTAGVFAH